MYRLIARPNRPGRQLELGELGHVHLRAGSELLVTDEQEPGVRQALEAAGCSADYTLRRLEAPRRSTARAVVPTSCTTSEPTAAPDAPAGAAEQADPKRRRKARRKRSVAE